MSRAEDPATIVTNLPVTIVSQTVTNVVAGDNQRGCSTCEMLRKSALTGMVPAIYHPFHNAEPWSDATERWTITNVVRRTILALIWKGKGLSNVEDVILSSTTNRFKLSSTWVPE